MSNNFPSSLFESCHADLALIMPDVGNWYSGAIISILDQHNPIINLIQICSSLVSRKQTNVDFITVSQTVAHIKHAYQQLKQFLRVMTQIISTVKL